MLNKKRSFRASANIFLLIALAIALPLTIFVAQQQQITQQQAIGRIKVGVNNQGLVHYGYYDTMSAMTPEEMDQNLAEMRSMGVRTVRVFVANGRISHEETANRLDKFLTKANGYGISVVINLLHFFKMYEMWPRGVEGYYTESANLGWGDFPVLNHDFWENGYKGEYTNFVRTVVSKNAYHTNIFAWEPCNECRDQDGLHPQVFLKFMQESTALIHSLDSDARISSGIEDTGPNRMSPQDFYGALPYVNVVSLHRYNGKRDDNGDAAYARSAGKMLLIGELGFSINRGDRPSLLTNELNYWEAQGAHTALLWGFSSVNHDSNDGDKDSGFDPLHFSDYDAIKAMVKKFNGVTDIPTTTAPPPTTAQSTTAPQPTTSQQTVYAPHSVTHSCNSADSTVTVYWQGGENATNYYIHLRNQTTGNQQDVLQSPSAGKSKTFSVTLGNEYNVWLEAVPNPQNSGAHVFICDANSTPVPQPTNIPVVTTNPSQPMNPPENLGFSCPNPSQVLLTWSGGENATQFEVHVLEEGKPLDQTRSFSSYGHSGIIDIETNKKYAWWMEAVRVINGVQETKASEGEHSFICNGSSQDNPPPPSNDPLGDPSNPQSRCENDMRAGVISWNTAANAQLHVLSVWLAGVKAQRIYSNQSLIEYYLPNIDSGASYAWEVYGYRYRNSQNEESGKIRDTLRCTFADDTSNPDNPGEPPPPTATAEPTPEPTLTPTPTPIPYPNCINLQGPTTIRLGRTVTYLAQYFAYPGGVLRGGMGAFNINSATPTDPATWNWNKTSDPYSINSNESVLRFSWTPTEIGNYHIFCQSIDDARNISCRGATAATAGEIALCKGPQTSMTVQVVSDEVPAASGRDMCQFATTIGSNAITSYQTVAVSAVAKPQFNIKNYTFAFFNADNQTKPIQFESGKSFKIESSSNTINLSYNAMHRIDLQTGTYPQNILMKAFFTDIDGNFSNEGTGCNITLLIDDKPVPTRAAPTTGPVETSAPERPGALQVAAGLLGIGTILAAFLTNRERIFEFRSRRRR